MSIWCPDDDQHRCDPPFDAPLVEDTRWTCPTCDRLFQVRMISEMLPLSYDTLGWHSQPPGGRNLAIWQ